MLTIHEPGSASSWAGITRRNFLRVGALALGGLSLGDILRLRAESPAPGRPRQKSVIMIHLSGGPSHLDMYDLKPNAPSEYRGEFRPIRTNVPGMHLCELMPRQAKIADKVTILRGVQLTHLHTANEFYSGFPWQDSPRVSRPGEAQRPALGSVVSRLRGGNAAIPPYVSLNNRADWERAYYLGIEHEPFRVGGGNFSEPLDNLRRCRDVSARRLENRKDLLHAFDTLRRDLDTSGALKGLDAFQARALQMVASGKVRDAFDLDKEPDKVRTRYGDQPFKVVSQECNVIKHHQVTHPGQALLQARRLVEAGVSVVTVAFHDWDTHRYNFTTLRQLLPPLDQALTALITDLDERGLLPDVAVLMGGEFGRTPRIGDVTPDGRSHWPEAGFLWIAGGGLKTGQVIGATDTRGERVVGNPIRMQNVLATLYHVLGIDPGTTFADYNGRPQYVLENREPVAELLW
ncbi:MAG TPA: DUF1501 domain-containing protein [Gemmataceae bacterium]|nr:DUF1501 domain-containing protein [Gemmataceae bacterium]